MIKTMKRIGENKIFRIVRDCIEWYLPMLAFVLMFIDFVAGIVARYVFRSPFKWTVDMASILFLYLVGFSACTAYRTNSHVRFTLLYELLPIKWKAITGFLGNLVICVTFIISAVPTWNYIQFMKISKASSLPITFNLIYFPYMFFLISTILYCGWEMIIELLVFTGIGGEEAVKTMHDWDNIGNVLEDKQKEEEV